MDCGANVECTAQMLDQFGAMGSFYMQKVLGVEQPRVGLANIGTEKTKGGPLQLEAYGLMEASSYHLLAMSKRATSPSARATCWWRMASRAICF